MLMKFKAFRLVREKGEEKLKRNLVWFDPREVIYFEQGDLATNGEAALISCLIALRNNGEAWELNCLFSQDEIDHLTRMLEGK